MADLTRLEITKAQEKRLEHWIEWAEEKLKVADRKLDKADSVARELATLRSAALQRPDRHAQYPEKRVGALIDQLKVTTSATAAFQLLVAGGLPRVSHISHATHKAWNIPEYMGLDRVGIVAGLEALIERRDPAFVPAEREPARLL